MGKGSGSGRLIRGLLFATALGGSAAACSASGTADATATQVARTRAEQDRQVATQAGLPADVADLLALAASAGVATFTADYELGTAGRSHVAQRPPKRVVEVATSDGTVSRFVATAAGSFSCRRSAGR